MKAFSKTARSRYTMSGKIAKVYSQYDQVIGLSVTHPAGKYVAFFVVI